MFVTKAVITHQDMLKALSTATGISNDRIYDLISSNHSGFDDFEVVEIFDAGAQFEEAISSDYKETDKAQCEAVVAAARKLFEGMGDVLVI